MKRTIIKESSFVYKKNKSRFIGLSFYIENKKKIKEKIKKIKQQHHKARHFCYACNIEGSFLSSDDGEPKNSASQTIKNQLVSNKLTNTLIIVVRYFGGQKLGLQTLTQAYKICAHETIIKSKTKIYRELIEYRVKCDFIEINSLERFIKKNKIKINNKNISNKCNYNILTTKSEIEELKKINPSLIVKKNN